MWRRLLHSRLLNFNSIGRPNRKMRMNSRLLLSFLCLRMIHTSPWKEETKACKTKITQWRASIFIRAFFHQRPTQAPLMPPIISKLWDISSWTSTLVLWMAASGHSRSSIVVRRRRSGRRCKDPQSPYPSARASGRAKALHEVLQASHQSLGMRRRLGR